MCFPEFCKISTNTFFTEHLWTTAFVLHSATDQKMMEICLFFTVSIKVTIAE